MAAWRPQLPAAGLLRGMLERACLCLLDFSLGYRTHEVVDRGQSSALNLVPNAFPLHPHDGTCVPRPSEDPLLLSC